MPMWARFFWQPTARAVSRWRGRASMITKMTVSTTTATITYSIRVRPDCRIASVSWSGETGWPERRLSPPASESSRARDEAATAGPRPTAAARIARSVFAQKFGGAGGGGGTAPGAPPAGAAGSAGAGAGEFEKAEVP